MSLTDEQLAQIRERHEQRRQRIPVAGSPMRMKYADLARDESMDAATLLAEVELLRAELASAEAERDKARRRLDAARPVLADAAKVLDFISDARAHEVLGALDELELLTVFAAASEPKPSTADAPRMQCGSLLRDPGQPLTLWRCVQDAGHDGAHWSRSRSHEWTDAEQYDPNADAPKPYAVWFGGCPSHNTVAHAQWTCNLCPASRCDPSLSAASARAEAERHIASQHPAVTL